MENMSAYETYRALFENGDTNLLRDYYLPGTNQWAAARKRLAKDEQKSDS